MTRTCRINILFDFLMSSLLFFNFFFQDFQNFLFFIVITDFAQPVFLRVLLNVHSRVWLSCSYLHTIYWIILIFSKHVNVPYEYYLIWKRNYQIGCQTIIRKKFIWEFQFWFIYQIVWSHVTSHVKVLRSKLKLVRTYVWITTKHFLYVPYTHTLTVHIRAHSFKWQLVPRA